MTVSEVVPLLLAGLAGMLFGAFFFGGLWWTVRKGMSSRRPALWFLGSTVMRLGVTVGGLFLVAGGRWQRVVLYLVGFVTARKFVMRLTRPAEKVGTDPRTKDVPCV